MPNGPGITTPAPNMRSGSPAMLARAAAISAEISGATRSGPASSTGRLRLARRRPARSTMTVTILPAAISMPAVTPPSGLTASCTGGWPRPDRRRPCSTSRPSSISTEAMLETACRVSWVSRAISARPSGPCRRTASSTTRRLCDRVRSGLLPIAMTCGARPRWRAMDAVRFASSAKKDLAAD